MESYIAPVQANATALQQIAVGKLSKWVILD